MCMFYVDVLCVCFMCMFYVYALYVCFICMFYVYVLWIVVCPFALFLLAFVLSLLVRFTDYDYPFGIFKQFLLTLLVNKHVTRVLMKYIYVIILLTILVYLKMILHLIFKTLVATQNCLTFLLNILKQK